MTAATRVDVAVIGGGPGGYVAALRAASHGLSAVVIERDRLGGVCANEGCIPTKALLRSAEVYALVKDAAAFGVHVAGAELDLAAVVERAARTAQRMEKGVEALLRGAKVPVLRGSARLAGGGRVVVAAREGNHADGVADGVETGAETVVEAASIVLATGARARVPAGLEPDGRLVWTYRHALVPDRVPSSLLVVGAGAIGVEFASFYRALGVDVTIVEALPRVLPLEDADIGDAMGKALRKRGIRVRTGARVAALERGADTVTATIESVGAAAAKQETITAERLLVATGIVANTDGLGLEATNVRLDRGHVVVDEWLRTDEPGVYAIGDLTGPPWLAHKASREAVVCIDRLAGVAGARPLERSLVPACTYATPQVASVGLTEEAARAAGRAVRVGRSTFVGNGKARAVGDTDGFVKTVFDAATGELLGAHLIGPEVTELVSTFALARTLEATEAELLATVFPHPTLAEALHESVEAAFAREG